MRFLSTLTLIVQIIFIVGSIGLAWYVSQRLNAWPGYRSEVITVEGKEVKVLVADTPEKRSKGLSGIKTLKGYDGMMFVFNPPQEVAFWNKETYLPLMLYWYRGDTLLGKDELPPVTQTVNVLRISSPDKVDRVVELVQ